MYNEADVIPSANSNLPKTKTQINVMGPNNTVQKVINPDNKLEAEVKETKKKPTAKKQLDISSIADEVLAKIIQAGITIPQKSMEEYESDTSDVEKPKARVEFNGAFGRLITSFHDVIVHDFMLVLLYDTRFDGSRYIPPTTNEPINIITNGTTYKVYNKGIMFPIDKLNLDVMVFLIDKSGQPN